MTQTSEERAGVFVDIGSDRSVFANQEAWNWLVSLGQPSLYSWHIDWRDTHRLIWFSDPEDAMVFKLKFGY